ncbi:hypothetical protein ACS0TY_030165 [Phlomoides rotata]
MSETFTQSKNIFLQREDGAINIQQKNQRWPDHVLHKFDEDQRLAMKHIIDLYNHSRRTAKVTTRVAGSTRYRTFRVSLSERECDCRKWKWMTYIVNPIKYVPECYSTREYALTYTSGFFAPLSDIEE